MKLRNKKTGEIIEGKCFTDIINKLLDREDAVCCQPYLNVYLFKQYWEEIPSYEQQETKYICEYAGCRCPNCDEVILLKIYASQPILKAELANTL